MIAGGFDDFSEEGSFEFANMGATSNSETEAAKGREPSEMSRPTSTSRDGVSLNSIIPSISILIPSIVHGGPRLWCPSCHERQDCPRDWCHHPRYRRLHLDVDVSSLGFRSHLVCAHLSL